MSIVIAVPAIWFFVKARTDEAAFQKQLSLARKEGLPTTAEEFIATLPKVAPEDNAAPYYRQLRGKLGNTSEWAALMQGLMYGDTHAVSIRRAKEELTNREEALTLIAEAIRRPKCSFDRDWKLGLAVLLPEFADMKSAARVLLLRGAMAAVTGRANDAIADIRNMLKVANHCKDGSTAIPELVGESIELIAMRALADWSYKYRLPLYSQELKRVLKQRHKPEPKRESRDILFSTLILLEQVSTTEGRQSLGISSQDEEVNRVERLFGFILDKGSAKVKLVESIREGWKALDAPIDQRRYRVRQASYNTSMALLAFPMAGRVSDALGYGDENVPCRVELWKCHQLFYQGALRALSEKVIPKAIRTDDLLSPFDGKPLIYRFDGRQIVIQVSTPKEIEFVPNVFKLPSDTSLK
mgnify:CR=1 FL=1